MSLHATPLAKLLIVLVHLLPVPALAGEPSAPQRLAPEALGQDGRITLTPAVTPDGMTMYFAQSECAPIWECPQQLKRSRLIDGQWSTPVPVPQTAGDRVDWPSVSPDGSTLLFSWATRRTRHIDRDVYEDFDLYSLDLRDPDAQPRPLDDPDINRIRGGAIRQLRFVHNETAPSLTRNGDLYFWTERLDGIGERDVFVAPSDGLGGFLPARPLPAPINSAERDDGVWVHPDGTLMLVTYSNRGGEGGADVFVSTRHENRWAEPVPLGPTVNSAFEDFAAALTPDDQQLLFTSTRPVPGRSDRIAQVWAIPVDEVPVLHERLGDRSGRGCEFLLWRQEEKKTLKPRRSANCPRVPPVQSGTGSALLGVLEVLKIKTATASEPTRPRFRSVE